MARPVLLLLALAGAFVTLSSASPVDDVTAQEGARRAREAPALGSVVEAATHRFRAVADADGTSAGGDVQGAGRGGARMLFPRVPRKSRSSAVTDLNCNRTGSKVTCLFCNLLPTAIQNVVLSYTSTLTGSQAQFDGTDRTNINKDGNLPISLKPDSCTKFSYKSKQILIPSVVANGVGVASCSDDFLLGTYGSFFDFSAGLTCWVTKQTVALTGGTNSNSAFTCEVTCRLVNFSSRRKIIFPFEPVPCPPFYAPDFPGTNAFGGLRYDPDRGTCELDRTVAFGESGLFGYTYPVTPL